MKKKLITTSLIAALMATPAIATQDEIDQTTVTSKYYVDTTKQDKITTDKVLFSDNDNDAYDVYVPAIVTTNDAGTALNGNTFGILNAGTIDYMGTNLYEYNSENYDDGSMDNFVPTVEAVANDISAVSSWLQDVSEEVGVKQNKMTCAGYVPGHENDIDYCWLYGDVQVAAAACLEYEETATSASQCCSGVLQSGMNTCGCNSLSDCPSGSINCDASHVCTVKSKV